MQPELKCKRLVIRRVDERSKRSLIYKEKNKKATFHLIDARCRQINLFGSIRSSFNSCLLCLVLLASVMQLPQASAKDIEILLCKYLHYAEECNKTLNDTIPINGTYCPGQFDGFICWPHGMPDSIVKAGCPEFLDFNGSSTAYRFCSVNGTWYQTQNENGEYVIWNHRLDCNPTNEDDYNEELDEAKNELSMLEALSVTYTAGYGISLFCLVISLGLFGYFRNLHCTRNYIHINLMISFILRYTTVLIKDSVIQSHYDPARITRLGQEEMKLFCDDYGGVSGFVISCRLVITLMHYAILANYFWLLAEGIHLQLLLEFPMANDKNNKYFPYYMAGGWGAPWIPVGVWVILRLTFENVGCWEMYESPNIFWSLRAPVILSIGINFIIFINVIRIIVMKLRAHRLQRNDYKMTLAKSTLALIPLLGIHYIVFLAITDDIMQSNDIVMKVKISFEMIFTSLQGMLIAVFYCFLNGEVQAEVKKLWKNIRSKHALPATKLRKCSNYYSNGTQVTAFACALSEDKSHAMQETCLLTPNSRHDSNASSRRSTFNSASLQKENSADGLSRLEMKVEVV